MASTAPFKVTVKKPISTPSTVDTSALPTNGGRQSYPDGINTLGGFLAELSFIQPDFPTQILEALEKLAMYHGDVSQAVENIVALGNTEYTIEFDDKVKDNDAKEMKARIADKEHEWYVYAGGLHSLINDLLAQVAIFGCLSAESIPTPSLDGVKKVAFVAPKHIRFKYNKETDSYDPYQHVPNGLSMTADTAGLIKLNTITYKYQTLRRFSEKPYPVPPFLAAIFHINIDRDMMDNMKHIIKKLGVLGFLEVLINAPKPKPNEDDIAYYNRSKKYLDDVVPEIEKGMTKGYVTGFKDRHEFNMHSTAQNLEGAKALVELNDTKMMTGLKQDPLMFGRNFSTTETLGRVILAKMTASISNYQNIVSTYLSTLFLLDLQLAGYNVTKVTVTFKKAMIGDRVKEAEAEAKEIENARTLYNMGIIDQTQVANRVGYEKPDQPEPRMAMITSPTDSKQDGKTDPSPKNTDATDPKSTDTTKNAAIPSVAELAKVFKAAGGDYAEYDYNSFGSTCCTTHSFSSEQDSIIQQYVDQYYEQTSLRYNKAVKNLTTTVGKALLKIDEGATEVEIVDSILYTLYKDFKGEFTDEMKGVIRKFVSEAYTFFRKDKSVFAAKDDVPKGAFRTIDYRAIDYYKNSDSFYLGKFITDDDLKVQITQYIKDEYLTRNLPIGNNAGALSKFKEKFGDILQGQDWKIRRIIDTTVNSMRNTAAVSYMDQAEVENFEIVGVADRLQCAYCKTLQGLTFSVKTAMDNFDSRFNVEPESVGEVSPFLTSIFKKPEDMAGLSGQELQDRGFTLVPAHCFCRDKIVAVL